MTRDKWQLQQHLKNLNTFREFALRIMKGQIQIMSINIDEPQFGHTRVVIFVTEPKEGSNR